MFQLVGQRSGFNVTVEPFTHREGSNTVVLPEPLHRAPALAMNESRDPERVSTGQAPTAWAAHAALVGGLRELTRSDVEDLWTRVADRFPRVTVIAVADAFSTVMPMGMSLGLGAVALVRKPLDPAGLSQAAEAARRVVEMAPPQVSVDHLVVRNWAEARRIVHRHGQAHILLADPPVGLVAGALVRRREWWGLPTGSTVWARSTTGGAPASVLSRCHEASGSSG